MVARGVARGVARAVARQVAGSGGGAAAWTPLNVSPLQYALDGGNAYESSTLDGKYVLRSLESYGTYRKPRAGYCYQADGVDDAMQWTKADSGTYYATYFDPAAGTWSAPAALSHNGTAYVFTPSAGKFTNLKIWSISNPSNEQIQAVTLADALGGLIAWHWCQEESGTTGYNVANTALNATLVGGLAHTTDSGVTVSGPNLYGFTLSGAVVIPRDEEDTTKDAIGGTLGNTGQCPHPVVVETPCITGDGSASYCDMGSALIPASADWSITFQYYHQTNDATIRSVWSQAINTAVTGRCWLLANASSGSASAGRMNFLAHGTASVQVNLAGALTAGEWHTITITRATNTFTVSSTRNSTGTTVSGSNSGSGIAIDVSRNTWLLRHVSGTDYYNDGRVCGFQITTGGVTYFPLQGGPGSSNTNRDLPYIKSDGTYAVVAGGVVGGTVANIWANRCPGYAQDWCTLYGGKLATNGAFLPGQISGTLAADGNAKTLTAGKFGNPYSRINFNPFSAPELTAIGVSTAYAKGDARQSVSPTDTKFRRTAGDGDDRTIAVATALTGTDLTNMESYVA